MTNALLAASWDDVRIKPHGTAMFLEAACNEIQGTTKFFRYESLFLDIVNYLEQGEYGPEGPRVLCAPSSVGCEPYTLAMIAEEMGLFEKYPSMKIYAFDRSPLYTDLAKSAVYPLPFLRDVPLEYKKYFKTTLPGNHGSFYKATTELKDDIRERVVFLESQNIAFHRPAQQYDLSICLHLMQHLKEPAHQYNTLGALLRFSHVVCVNSINPTSKKASVIRNAFKLKSNKHVLSAGGQGFQFTRGAIGRDAPDDCFKQFDEPVDRLSGAILIASSHLALRA